MYSAAICLTVAAVVVVTAIVGAILTSLKSGARLPDTARSEGIDPLISPFVRSERERLQPDYMELRDIPAVAGEPEMAEMSTQPGPSAAWAAALCQPETPGVAVGVAENLDNAVADREYPALPEQVEYSCQGQSLSSGEPEDAGSGTDQKPAGGEEPETVQVACEHRTVVSISRPSWLQEGTPPESPVTGLVKLSELETEDPATVVPDALPGLNTKRMVLSAPLEPDLKTSSAAAPTLAEASSDEASPESPKNTAAVDQPVEAAQPEGASEPVEEKGAETGSVEAALKVFERAGEEDAGRNQLVGSLEDVDILGLLEFTKEISARLERLKCVNGGTPPNCRTS